MTKEAHAQKISSQPALSGHLVYACSKSEENVDSSGQYVLLLGTGVGQTKGIGSARDCHSWEVLSGF